MLDRDVADEFLNENGLADARAAEEADLSALGVRCDEVDDLNACLENLGYRLLVLEARCLAVDWAALGGFHGATLVDGVSRDIEHATKGLLSDGDGDGASGVDRVDVAREAVGRGKRDAPDDAVAEVKENLGDDLSVAERYMDRVQNLGNLPLVKTDIDDRADNLYYLADIFRHC